MTIATIPKMMGLYYHELGFLCTIVRDNCEKVFEVAKPPEQGRLYHILPMEIHARIWPALAAAANVYKLLDVGPRRRTEKDAGYGKRLGRATVLREELKGVKLKAMLEDRPQLRNVLEHLDEYLDELAIELEAHGNPTVVTHNIALTHRANLRNDVGPVEHLRCYESSTREFFYRGETVNLGTLHDEAAAILDRLTANDRIRQTGTTAVMSFANFGGTEHAQVEQDSEGNEVVVIDRKPGG